MLRLFAHAALILLLTAVTQIGGLVYLLALPLRRLLFRHSRRPALVSLVLFLLLYTGSTLALHNGWATPRAGLPCWDGGGRSFATASPLYCVLNRHYVSPGTYGALASLAEAVDKRFPGTLTQILDAGFPFFIGFSLLPHLSHDDGRKVDIAFYYQDADAKYRRGALASPIGYWGFTAPRPGEWQPCAGEADTTSLRWDMNWFPPLVRTDLTMDEARTKAALQWLAGTQGKEHGVSRILLEPHLKARLGLTGDRIGFQGCGAARHDDHIHAETGG